MSGGVGNENPTRHAMDIPPSNARSTMQATPEFLARETDDALKSLGLERTTIKKELVPAILSLSSVEDVARNCPAHILRDAYALQTGVNTTLATMQSAKWHRKTSGASQVLTTRDPEVLKAHANGDVTKLIDTLIAPGNNTSPRESATVMGSLNGELTIGGNFAVQWLGSNGVGPAPVTPTRHL